MSQVISGCAVRAAIQEKDAACQSKEAFETYIRELRRPDIGDEANELAEADFVSDLGEDGWPDACRWREIYAQLCDGRELTPREREQALSYWDAGEEYPPDDMRLDPCDAPHCPLRAIKPHKDGE